MFQKLEIAVSNVELEDCILEVAHRLSEEAESSWQGPFGLYARDAHIVCESAYLLQLKKLNLVKHRRKLSPRAVAVEEFRAGLESCACPFCRVHRILLILYILAN